MTQDTTAAPEAETAERYADAELTHQVAQFYFREAELLDDGRFADWLDVFDDDLAYFAPLRTNRLRRQAALSIGRRGEAAYFDETKTSRINVSGAAFRSSASAPHSAHVPRTSAGSSTPRPRASSSTATRASSGARVRPRNRAPGESFSLPPLPLRFSTLKRWPPCRPIRHARRSSAGHSS